MTGVKGVDLARGRGRSRVPWIRPGGIAAAWKRAGSASVIPGEQRGRQVIRTVSQQAHCRFRGYHGKLVALRARNPFLGSTPAAAEQGFDIYIPVSMCVMQREEQLP